MYGGSDDRRLGLIDNARPNRQFHKMSIPTQTSAYSKKAAANWALAVFPIAASLLEKFHRIDQRLQYTECERYADKTPRQCEM